VPTKVLIIDDAVHIRRIIVRMLEQFNFTTLEAGDGLQGLQKLQAERPDIVTCDISMPIMDGYEFLEAAKKDPETKDIPIVVITAIGQEEEMIKSLEMGADACITKPFSSSHLVEVLETQLIKRDTEPKTPA
jgi:CheY-like chemotaxis protein